MNPFRPASHFRYFSFSSGSSAIGTARVANDSASPRGTGTTMHTGSQRSNRIHSNGRVTFQFMVNVDTAQSASTTPSSAWIPSFGRLLGPFTHRLMPGGVRNRYGREKVSTPYPKWLDTHGSLKSRNRNSMSLRAGPPYQ